MKISFLIPPCYDHKQPPERSAGCTRVVYPAPNIYELTVAAELKQNPDYDVRYVDFVYDGKSPAEFEQFVRNDDSDVYLIWTVNLSIDSDVTAIAVIRKHRPELPILLLGPGGTYFTERCLVDSNVYVVRGEPDATVAELLSVLDEGKSVSDVLGISYLCDGVVKNNPFRPLIKDLDSLPYPARDLLAGKEYHNAKLKMGPYTTMFTSRNCPYKCIFCVPSSLTFAREIEFRREFGRKPTIGFRSVESVADEIRLLHEQGYKAIGFMDDNFIWNEERTRGICEALRRYGMVWGCQARVDAITEPIAQMLSTSGCMYVDLGIESFDDRILRYVKKGITADDIYRAIDILKKYKVPVKLNVLIGSSPDETRETILHTLSEAKKLDVDQVMFNIVSPFPGTEYYLICKENGWIKGGDYRPTDVQRNSILNLPHISAEEMERLLYRNNVSFFLSWKFVSKQLKRFSSWKEFTFALKALKIKLFGK